jgi:8-amino-7-oxononanoate synthase
VSGLVDSWARQTLASLEAQHLKRSLEPLESPVGARVRIDGRELLNFSSNDYLGLANDGAVVEAARGALLRHGLGAGASRLVVGDTAAHQSLERALARFEGTEAAVLFNSGYAANVGALSALFGPGDVLFSDALNHASLIDGCRLSRAQVVVYPHRDVEALEALVASSGGRRSSQRPLVLEAGELGVTLEGKSGTPQQRWRRGRARPWSICVPAPAARRWRWPPTWRGRAGWWPATPIAAG